MPRETSLLKGYAMHHRGNSLSGPFGFAVKHPQVFLSLKISQPLWPLTTPNVLTMELMALMVSRRPSAHFSVSMRLTFVLSISAGRIVAKRPWRMSLGRFPMAWTRFFKTLFFSLSLTLWQLHYNVCSWLDFFKLVLYLQVRQLSIWTEQITVPTLWVRSWVDSQILCYSKDLPRRNTKTFFAPSSETRRGKF